VPERLLQHWLQHYAIVIRIHRIAIGDTA